jgi:outer membrane lipoprotein-sorting protein
MKKIILYVAVLGLSIGTLPAQSVDEIVTKYLNAIGGVAKLHEVKSIVIENTIKVQGLEIENLITILVGKAMRSDSKIMGNDMVQAFDGTTPWAITPTMMGGTGEPQEMPGEMSKTVISQIDPFPLLDYLKKGTKLELLASEKVKDKEAYHLKMSPKGGAGSEIWIDVSSGLMSKIKTVQNGQEVEVVFSNYTEIEGINFAMSMETSNPMAGIITIDTKTVKINVAIDELIFKMPIKNN